MVKQSTKLDNDYQQLKGNQTWKTEVESEKHYAEKKKSEKRYITYDSIQMKL
jgi:hypothetical protein